MKILIMNGPNLGQLGKRETHIYGTETMDTVLSNAKQLENVPELELFQSNHEGILIDRLEKAREEFLEKSLMGIILNAGAFTHTSLALADCLAWVKIPFVEVHISNIFERAMSENPMRSQTLIAKYSLGIIAGFGMDSYMLAIQALIRYKNKIN